MRDELLEAARKSSSVTFKDASDELDRIRRIALDVAERSHRMFTVRTAGRHVIVAFMPSVAREVLA
jgi:hypothetical protein